LNRQAISGHVKFYFGLSELESVSLEQRLKSSGLWGRVLSGHATCMTGVMLRRGLLDSPVLLNKSSSLFDKTKSFLWFLKAEQGGCVD
jgi:hypothetical protein